MRFTRVERFVITPLEQLAWLLALCGVTWGYRLVDRVMEWEATR